MRKKTVAGAVVLAAVAAVLGAAVLMDAPRTADEAAFHVTLASPGMYEDGVYSEDIFLDAGEYRLRFVPNGDSPRVLGVSLSGGSLEFSEDFRLKGTLHETGISEYYTWKYLGQDTITASGGKAIITIDPGGNLLGPVSVSIIRE